MYRVVSNEIYFSESSYEYCVNAQALTLIQVISGFCFLAIATSLFSFVLDITSPQHKILWKVLKRYSFGYIFTGKNKICYSTAYFNELFEK